MMMGIDDEGRYLMRCFWTFFGDGMSRGWVE